MNHFFPVRARLLTLVNLGNACVVCLSTGVAVKIARQHFSKNVDADVVTACILCSSTPAVRVMCFYKSGRMMPLELGLAHPLLSVSTSTLLHTVDMVLEWGDTIAITSSSRILVYKRDDLFAKSSNVSDVVSTNNIQEDQLHHSTPSVASCALLPQVPSFMCALTGYGGLLAVSCDTKLVVVVQRDYRMLTAQLGVCHSMAAAGPMLLVTLGKDGVLRIFRVCIQQQHMLLHLLWVGDRYFDKPLFGCLQVSTAMPLATCIFLPDASVMRIAVCPTCDVVAMTTLTAAPKRGRVVVAVAQSLVETEPALQRTAVMFDDGHVSLWAECATGPVHSSQLHVGPFNSQLRLLGLFGRWLLLCDGSSLRLFDCGDYFVPPHVNHAMSSLIEEHPAVKLFPADSEVLGSFTPFQALSASAAQSPDSSAAKSPDANVIIGQTDDLQVKSLSSIADCACDASAPVSAAPISGIATPGPRSVPASKTVDDPQLQLLEAGGDAI